MTDAEYDRLMEEIEEENMSYWIGKTEQEIAEEIATELLLTGWHLAPESTQ